MSDATPTIGEARPEMGNGRPLGQRPPDVAAGDAVALRGTPARTAAPAPPIAPAPPFVPMAAAPVPGPRRSVIVLTTAADRLVQMVWLFAATVETVLGLRVLFHALSANHGTTVVRFIDFVSSRLMAPFGGIVDDHDLSNGGSLDISALITMGVFLVAAFIVARVIRIALTPRTAVAT